MVPAWPKEARSDLAGRMAGMNDTPFVVMTKLLPPTRCSTHCLNNPESDAIISRIHSLSLHPPFTRVLTEVLYVPCLQLRTQPEASYNLSVHDLAGCRRNGIPLILWNRGATLRLSVAFGVPTVTTSFRIRTVGIKSVGKLLPTNGCKAYGP